MSKSLGNSPDPLDLIAKYGADGVRMGMLLSSPAGNDLPFDEALCEQGRNFNNKIWNAFRLVKGWEVADIEQPKCATRAVEWFNGKLSETIENINDLFSKYRISEALMEVYKLFWDEFSSWYLEMIKPAHEQPIDKKTYEITLKYFDDLLKLLHSFMPFISEELWQALKERKAGESIMNSLLPEPTYAKGDRISIFKNANALSLDIERYRSKIAIEFEDVKEIITNIRNIRLQNNIPNKEKVSLLIKYEYDSGSNVIIYNEDFPVIEKMGNLSQIENVQIKPKNAVSFLVRTTEFFIPLEINVEKEIAKIQPEIERLEGFLKQVNAKLSNEKFVANAKPEVVEVERKKQSDAESKIASLKESIEQLKK